MKKHLKGSDKLESWLRMPQGYNFGKYFNCAVVFFENNESEISAPDREKLKPIRENFRKMLENYCWIYLDAHATASAPGSERYNMNLSMKRSNTVLNFFKDELGDKKRFICGRTFRGEEFARPERRFHSVDRKVIVRVKIVLGRDPTSEFQGYERAYISRVKIFRRFSPHYKLWKVRGLDYLIEEWEKLWENSHEDKLKIREKDYDKVVDLMVQRFPPDIKKPFLIDLKHGVKAKVIHEYYHLLYRRDYNEAYNIYFQVEDVNIIAEILAQKY